MILDRLRGILGEEAVDELPREIEGAKLEATLRPGSGEAVADTLRCCSEESAGLLIRGGATKLSFANAPCRARFLLDLGDFDGRSEIDPEEGVALLSAASTLTSVRDALDGTGWELPLESPDEAATVGGTIATAALAPRFGSPRDFVLGMHAALASGERVKFGGRVVKNVTGYDLNKLFTGSHGTLGVIESAWVRLRPVPEEVSVLEVDAEGLGPADVLAACRRSSVRVGSVHREGALVRLRLELAGDAPAVEADAGELAALGCRPTEPVPSVTSVPDPSCVRVRLAVLPTAGSDAADLLAAAGARVDQIPARGLVWADFALPETPDERAIGTVWQVARLAAERGQGHFVVESAPMVAREGREVFGDPGETVPLQRAIKAQYDPAGILNPGRFVAGA